MTQEQKTKISEHFDELHAIVSDCGFNPPNDISDALRAAYLAGADYALDIYRPRWISVKDDLPKEEGWILICSYRDVDMWYYDGQTAKDLMDYASITHWMPLPSVEHLRETTKMIEKGDE